MTKPGRPTIGSSKCIKQNISFTPEDYVELANINPNISHAIRQVMKERKERQHNG